ncbi:uncharacterized protein LOC117580186 [Drosophila guanche]|uniref:Uncharacterized protein n=1 Tax=Drosophila guanche TaxID=7266 RepID=A0A3B0JNC1_DROGU|nr:uncharacterized protein LOC117580186 [Drosophila guanche]XP_034122565.1 uncharacterized protein LOC117580186 [Drosophila guanche]SPP74836.1 Hypothetical predicted protein [Drosophila guanche]
MDSVKSFFAGSNKDNNLANHQQQTGQNVTPNRWGRNWNCSSQHTESSSSSNPNPNHCNAKRKDSDNYFYIMWRA